MWYTFYMKFLLLGILIFATFIAYADALKLMKQGHYFEAYTAYTNIIFSEDTSVNESKRAQSLLDASRCLVKLKNYNEAFEFLKSVASSRDEFAVVVACSQALGELCHTGTIIKGQYLRGENSSTYSSCEYDRVLRLRWLVRIMPRVYMQSKLRQRWFWTEVVESLEMNGRNKSDAWKLFELTNLTKLPIKVVKIGGRGSDSEQKPAQIDEKGEVVFHSLPKSWGNAPNDGQRWMYANDMRAAVDPRGREKSAKSLGDFAYWQFGVINLHSSTNMIATLKTLEDDETLMEINGEIKKIKLPMEYNYLRMWREIKDYKSIGKEYERRYQFAKAVKAYEIGNLKEDMSRIVDFLASQTKSNSD